MGRLAVAFQGTNDGSGVVDGSAAELLSPHRRPGGDSAVRACATGSALPEPALLQQKAPDEEDACGEQQVTLQQIWFQLSPRDRRRFGHCFSHMILKAVGLYSAAQQEVWA